MKTRQKDTGFIRLRAIVIATVAVIVGIYIDYSRRSYREMVLTHEGWDYVDTPVDCRPCDEVKEYEWFYVDLPPDSDLLRKNQVFSPVNEEGGEAMGP